MLFRSLSSTGTVNGESVVTPLSIVHLLVKLPILPPGATAEKFLRPSGDCQGKKQILTTCEDAEDLDSPSTNGFSQATQPGVSSSDTFYENYFHFLSISF